MSKGHWSVRVVMLGLRDVGLSCHRTQGLSTRWSSPLPRMTLRNRKGWGYTMPILQAVKLSKINMIAHCG